MGRTHRGSWTYVALVSLLAFGCATDTTAARPKNALVVGALLPFTGERASLGVNLERMLLTLTNEINAAGGISGQPLYVAAYDTHSQTTRGRDEAEALLREPGLLGVLGPEDPDLLQQIGDRFAEANVVNLLPGIVASMPPSALSFRLTPATSEISGALAKLVHEDGHQTATIVHAEDVQSMQQATTTACELKRLGIEATLVSIGDDWTVNLETLRTISASNPQALMLLAYPRTGAQVITYWQLFALSTKWYLGPTLDTNEFVQNVPPGSLATATGIAAALAWYAGAMTTLFQERWGDYPVTTAFYYYDALAALALAIQSAALQGPVTPEAIAQHLALVTNPPGERVGWVDGQNMLTRGFAILQEGGKVNYEGLTGAFDIGAEGSIRQDLLRTWSVVSNELRYSSTPASYTEFLRSPCAGVP